MGNSPKSDLLLSHIWQDQSIASFYEDFYGDIFISKRYEGTFKADLHNKTTLSRFKETLGKDELYNVKPVNTYVVTSEESIDLQTYIKKFTLCDLSISI